MTGPRTLTIPDKACIRAQHLPLPSITTTRTILIRITATVTVTALVIRTTGVRPSPSTAVDGTADAGIHAAVGAVGVGMAAIRITEGIMAMSAATDMLAAALHTLPVEHTSRAEAVTAAGATTKRQFLYLNQSGHGRAGKLNLSGPIRLRNQRIEFAKLFE